MSIWLRLIAILLKMGFDCRRHFTETFYAREVHRSNGAIETIMPDIFRDQLRAAPRLRY